MARGFSGDKAQLVPLIKAGIKYRGFAVIDVISPCVTFNNHATSTKSYDYVRDHNAAIGQLDMVESQDEIRAEYAAGSSIDVALHDGSNLTLHKLAPDYDPTDPLSVQPELARIKAEGAVATGLLSIDPQENDLHALMETSATSLNAVDEADLCPGSSVLETINGSHR